MWALIHLWASSASLEWVDNVGTEKRLGVSSVQLTQLTAGYILMHLLFMIDTPYALLIHSY